jgi:predicted  nucleic acid-binding Zn-ribbon protein
MAGPASVFREIHRLRRFIRDAQEQIDRIPRQRKAYQAKLAKAEQTLAEEKEAIKKLKVLGADREKTLKSTEEQISRYRTQLESASNKKISDALTLEIAAARERTSKLEDEILGSITEGEDRQAKVPELEAAVSAVRADLAKFEADIAPRKAMLDANVQQSQAQLAEQEKQIPDDLRDQYRRTVASQGADGFALAENGTCMGCHTEITRQVQMDLARDLFVMCRSCGRILYPPAGVAKPDEAE